MCGLLQCVVRFRVFSLPFVRRRLAGVCASARENVCLLKSPATSWKSSHRAPQGFQFSCARHLRLHCPWRHGAVRGADATLLGATRVVVVAVFERALFVAVLRGRYRSFEHHSVRGCVKKNRHALRIDAGRPAARQWWRCDILPIFRRERRRATTRHTRHWMHGGCGKRWRSVRARTDAICQWLVCTKQQRNAAYREDGPGWSVPTGFSRCRVVIIPKDVGG